MNNEIIATYYLEFVENSKTLAENIKDFFSWATMGSNKFFPYVNKKKYIELSGKVLNVIPDANNKNKGIVKYAFAAETFNCTDLSLLQSYLLYSSIQGSTSQLQLIDLELPSSFSEAFKGPKYGVEGLKKIMNVYEKPMFGVIIKPRQCLTADLVSQIALAAIRGGADYLIDDEVMVNQPGNTIEERIKTFRKVLLEDKIKKPTPLYIVNITSDYDNCFRYLDILHKYHDESIPLGIMINGITMGFPLIKKVSESTNLPVVATTVGCGMFVLSPMYNISEHIIVEFSRYCGADAIYAIRHETELKYDPTKLNTILEQLSKNILQMKHSIPVYAGSISLKTFLNAELPNTNTFMIQSGSTVCSFNTKKYSFPKSIEISTKILSESLNKIYLENYSTNNLRSWLLKKYSSNNEEVLNQLGYFKG